MKYNYEHILLCISNININKVKFIFLGIKLFKKYLFIYVTIRVWDFIQLKSYKYVHLYIQKIKVKICTYMF